MPIDVVTRENSRIAVSTTLVATRVAMLAHEIPPISEVQNTGDRHGQDDGIEGLGDNHDENGSCLEDRHYQPEQ